MCNFVKGLFLLLIGLVCIVLPFSCVVGCVVRFNKEGELKKNNTVATVFLEGPTYGEPWGDNSIASYAHISFKNDGEETIYTITCTVTFYDNEGNNLGSQKVEYNSHKPEFNELEVGETSPIFVLSILNKQGVKATSIKVKDYMVNGYIKVSGYE